MLICTCLNTSKMSSNFPPFLGTSNLSGYGALGTKDLGGISIVGVAVDGSASFSSVLPLSCPSYAAGFSSGRTTWLSTCLLDLSVTTAYTCSCPCTAFDELPSWNCNFGFGTLLSLPQVTSNLPNLGLHLGNSLSVHHGSILHIIDGLPCKLYEGLEGVF
jgi:hypothetical protein